MINVNAVCKGNKQLTNIDITSNMVTSDPHNTESVGAKKTPRQSRLDV